MIIVKPACEDDSKDIFTWRNDKRTREMSLTTDPVAWEGLDAEIKSTNRASITTFQEVGFSQVGEDSSLLHFQCKV